MRLKFVRDPNLRTRIRLAQTRANIGKHDGVHKHPANERRRSALVERTRTFSPYRRFDAIEWTLETARHAFRLHPHLDANCGRDVGGG